MTCVCAFAAEANEYAVLTFDGISPVTENLTSVKIPEGMLSETTAGGSAAVSLKTSSYSNIVLDIDKSFARRVTDGSGFDVTVEYFDSGKGNFRICYDAVDNSAAETEIVELGDTNQWKTHTFHLYDAYFGNRLSNGDLALKLYTSTMRQSSDDVVFRKIKIEKTGKRFPYTIKESVKRTGNFYYKGETPEIALSIKNAGEAATLNYSIKSGRNGETAVEKTGIITLTAGDNSVIIPTGVTACAAYDANIVFFNDGDIYGEYNTSFSVSVNAAANPKFGFNAHFTHNGGKTAETFDYRNPTTTIPNAQAEGASMVRDCFYWSQYVANGNKMPQHWIDAIEEETANGVDILVLLAGGSSQYDGGGFPKSDEALKAWGEYVYDMVSSLKGKADKFQIWNEYHHTANNTQSEAIYYTKLLKVSYEQAKKANPNCTVVGMSGLPGVWAWWVDWMLDAGAGPYMDAMSCHEYDAYKNPEYRMTDWLKDIKTKLANHGYGNMPVWVTETGWSTADVSERKQAAWSVRQYVLYSDIGIEKYFPYDFQNDGALENDREMSFGATYAPYEDAHLPQSAKELYVAYSNMNDKLGGAEVELNRNSGNSYIYKYTNGVWVVWNSEGKSNETIDAGVETVMLCDMFGNTELVRTTGGKVTVAASEEPMYVIPVYFSVDEINYAEKTVTATVDNITANTSPTIMVLKPGKTVSDIYTDKVGALAYIGQADGTSSFTFTFKASTEGTYSVYLNNGDEIINIGTAFNYPTETAVSLSQNGKDIIKFTDISDGDGITAKAVIKDAYSGADYIFICGLYENGVMKSAKTGREPVNTSDDTKEITIDISADGLKNVDEIKLFLWKDKTLLVPVRNVYGIE